MKEPFIYQPNRVLLKKQINEVAHLITGKVLDVGAGHNDRYSHAFKNKTEYIRLSPNKNDRPDVVGSAYAIPFADEEFDSIVCTEVFEHLAYPEKAAKEISRVLKKGGRILLTAPMWNELHEKPHDYFRYTHWGIMQILTDVGFSFDKGDEALVMARGGFYSLVTQMTIRHLTDIFNFYNKPILGRIFGRVSKIMTYASIALDKIWFIEGADNHLGWLVTAKKGR